MVDRSGRKVAVIAGLLILFARSVCGHASQGIDIVMTGPDAINQSGLEWKKALSIPPGAQMVMIDGSPDKPGPYVFRVQFPAGYKLPAHRHQDQRAVTVLSGSYWSAVGDAFDQSKLTKFAQGAYYITGPGVPHFAWAETDVIIQEMGIGPVSNPIEYMHSEDDPRTRQ